jgi:gamma-glutamyltranspeptidase/glutathione hydrolase
MSDLAPRFPVLSASGLAVAGQSLVASAGAQMLARGGHAVDAALAMAAVAGVTMPEMCGLGGDAFALVYDADSRSVTAYNGSGPAPAMASVERYREAGHSAMPYTGWWSVAVPGALCVYQALHQAHARLGLDELWQPAIGHARNGYPVDQRTAVYLQAGAELLAADPYASKIYLPAGRPLRAGELLRNPDLARSFELLAADPSALWSGELAARVARASEEQGGLVREQDLSLAPAVAYPPLSTSYRGHRVHTTAPPSQGLLLLEMLNLLEGFDVDAMDPDSSELVHLAVEMKKLAFADRNRFMGDPAFVDAPTERLISKEHADARRGDFDPDKAAMVVNAHDSGDTTSFVVVDRDGNAVSFIQSLSAAFGAGVVAGDTGILLNNRAGRGFVLDERHPNCLAPGKRTMHTLLTYLVTDESGALELVGNTPGGDAQSQHGVQVLMQCLDWGADVGAATAAPKWLSLPGTDPDSLDQPMRVVLESRFADETAEGLRARGHEVVVVGPWGGGGSLTLIRARGDGVFEGCADPRDTGQALGV